MRDFIYYYKENKSNVPVLTGTGNDLSITFCSENIKEIINRFPKAKGNLYVLIDGTEFKLD